MKPGMHSNAGKLPPTHAQHSHQSQIVVDDHSRPTLINESLTASNIITDPLCSYNQEMQCAILKNYNIFRLG